MKQNKESITVKSYAHTKGVRLWEVAERMGISEFTLSRWLRHVSDEDFKKYKSVIDEIRAGEKNDRG